MAIQPRGQAVGVAVVEQGHHFVLEQRVEGLGVDLVLVARVDELLPVPYRPAHAGR